MVAVLAYFVDVIGVVKSVDECKTFVGKASNQEIKKRDITMVDESQVQIRLTLWGTEVHLVNKLFLIYPCSFLFSVFRNRNLFNLSSWYLLINPTLSL